MNMNTIKRKNIKHCEWCNVIFEYTQPTTKYCSNACKHKAHRLRVKESQTHKPVAGYSDKIETYYTSQLDELKEYVRFLESQIVVLFKEKDQTRSELMAAHHNHIKLLTEHFQKQLNQVYEQKGLSLNQAQNEENSEQIFAALANIAQNLFKK